jgi:hypothetical protein
MTNKRMKIVTTPKAMSLVKCVLSAEKIKEFQYPFNSNVKYIFLGEIANMPGHCVVIDYNDGRIFSGYHTDDFAELTESEL